MNKRVLIIGAGWLGLPLALQLEQSGYTVAVTKTSQSSLKPILTYPVKGYVCKLATNDNQDLISSAIENILLDFQPDIVIGSFPPGFRSGNGGIYAMQWQTLTRAVQNSNASKLVMISSSTVYPSVANVMTEDKANLALASTDSSFSDKARIMLQAEQYVIDSGLNYCIIRCSGLFGPDRHPARFATKLKQVSRLAPANMLHLSDAVGVAQFALEELNREVINATTPHTVNKEQFYRAAIADAKLDCSFPPVIEQTDKSISSEKLVQRGYTFHLQSVLDAFTN